MWRNRKGFIYLEPGEVAALVALARQAVPEGAATHPRELMFAALGDVLGDVIDGPGVVIAPAPASVVRPAAQAYVLQPTDAHRAPAGPGPARSHRIRLA